MKNTQKGSINVWLVGIILIFIIVIGYFAFIRNPASSNQEVNTSPVTPRSPMVTKTKSQLFLETMSVNLGINKPVVSATINSYQGFGFGEDWIFQDVQGNPASFSKYIQDHLPKVLGQYTSESGTGYSNGEIVCVIQGMRKFITDSPPATTHNGLVCMDIK